MGDVEQNSLLSFVSWHAPFIRRYGIVSPVLFKKRSCNEIMLTIKKKMPLNERSNQKIKILVFNWALMTSARCLYL